MNAEQLATLVAELGDIDGVKVSSYNTGADLYGATAVVRVSDTRGLLFVVAASSQGWLVSRSVAPVLKSTPREAFAAALESELLALRNRARARRVELDDLQAEHDAALDVALLLQLDSEPDGRDQAPTDAPQLTRVALRKFLALPLHRQQRLAVDCGHATDWIAAGMLKSAADWLGMLTQLQAEPERMRAFLRMLDNELLA